MESIILIFAESCEKCKIMRQTINAFIKVNSLSDEVELLAHNCQDDESIEVALNNDMTDVPSCRIRDIVIEGEDYKKKDLLAALEKLLN